MKYILWATLSVVCVLVGCSTPTIAPSATATALPTDTPTIAPTIEADEATPPPSSVVVHQYDTYDMTIAHVPTFEFIYNECMALSVEEIVAEQPYEYLINSSFFHYADENDAACLRTGRSLVHVGHLRFGGTTYPSKEMNQFDHDQLTHVVQYEPAVPRITFIDEDDFVPLEPTETDDVIEFQTGPIVIQNSEIAQVEIDNSFNGEGRYPRSLIATTDQTEIFLITVREGAELDELAEILLTLEIFQDKRLDVLNLDGGLSTLVYAPRHEQLFWSATEGSSGGISRDPLEARLPFFIGVPDS